MRPAVAQVRGRVRDGRSEPALIDVRCNTSWRRIAALAPAICLAACTGCVVTQPRGEGKLARVVEPTTDRGYWLYLPRDYVREDDEGRRARRWPLVVSFHGMKPFDTSYAQACEWQQEADRYGYIVVSPELSAPDVLHEFPLQHVHPAFEEDERETLAVLDHVLDTTHADPGNVLSTSWSSGGYMAHYMLNRHPGRFTALAVRQSNFSAAVLDAALTERSRYHPVLIVNTEHDIPICKDESRDAIRWYNTHGYRNVAWVMIRRLGHERTPDLAADFFARVAQVQPTAAPTVLVNRQTIDGNADGIALLSGKLTRFEAPPRPVEPPVARRPTPPRALPPRTTPPASDPREESVVRAIPERPRRMAPATAQRSAAEPPRRPARMLTITASPRTGIEPLYFSFSAECPADWHTSAEFLWTLNGEAIATGVNGQKTLGVPGDHVLELVVVTPDGGEHRASQTIRVIPRLSSAASVPGH